jgi:hypothetical protein
LKAKELKNSLSKAISGGVFGIRVMETLVDINNGRIGVIIGRSPDTTRDAGQLRAQNLVAKPLPTAFEEAIELSNAIVSAYEGMMQEPPFGLMGVRGKRLSNGEIVYFGYGTAMQKAAMDEVDDMENSLAIETAQTKALSALNEFSYMSAESRFSYDFEKVVEKVISETLDMAEQGKVVNIEHSLKKELRAMASRQLSAQASGFLKNPQEIETSPWSGGEQYPDFYLSIYAWSPSIMTNASQSHDRIVSGYAEGQRRSDGVPAASSPTPKSGVKAFRLNEDW